MSAGAHFPSGGPQCTTTVQGSPQTLRPFQGPWGESLLLNPCGRSTWLLLWVVHKIKNWDFLHPTWPLFQSSPRRSLTSLALTWFPANLYIKANNISNHYLRQGLRYSILAEHKNLKLIKQKCYVLYQSQFYSRKPLSSLGFYDRNGFFGISLFFTEKMLFWRDWMIPRLDTEKLFVHKLQ